MLAKFRNLIRRTIRAALHTGHALVAAVRGRRFLLLADLYRAIDAGRLLVIGYRKGSGEASTRAVRPLNLRPTEAGHIVLRAFDCRDDADTTFRIDRIHSHQSINGPLALAA